MSINICSIYIYFFLVRLVRFFFFLTFSVRNHHQHQLCSFFITLLLLLALFSYGSCWFCWLVSLLFAVAASFLRLKIIIPTAPHLVTSPHRTSILLSPLFSSCSVLASVFLVAVCFSYGSSSLQSEEQRMSCCFHWSTLLGSSLLLLYVLVAAVVDVRVNVQCSSSCPSSSLR